MYVLVTGASGFIGRRLVRRLIADGHRVRALQMPADVAAPLAGTEPFRADLTDVDAMRRACEGIDWIFHLAARVGDWGTEEEFVSVNVEGTRNLLEGAWAARCSRVVMVSSIVVYGWRLHDGQCDEDAPREYGVGPYGRTKRASEELALDYHAFGRVPVTVVRPGNVFGPGSGLWVDELARVIRAGQGLLIDGGAGDATLAYVDNVVEVIAAATAVAAEGRIYNVNDGSGVTWRQYFADLAGLLGCPPPTRSVPSGVAMATAAALERVWRALRRSDRPLVTREAVTLLASRHAVPIERARRELNFRPVPYEHAMAAVADYVRGELS